MIASTEEGWVVLRDGTSPTDYTTGSIPAGTVVIIDYSLSRDECAEAERLAKIIEKAAAEYNAAIAKEEFEEIKSEQHGVWPAWLDCNTNRPRLTRESVLAKARGPPVTEEVGGTTIKPSIFFHAVPGKGGRVAPGPLWCAERRAIPGVTGRRETAIFSQRQKLRNQIQ